MKPLWKNLLRMSDLMVLCGGYPTIFERSKNGTMARSIADRDVDDAAPRAIRMAPDHCAAMFTACRVENLFNMRACQDEARECLGNLCGLR